MTPKILQNELVKMGFTDQLDVVSCVSVWSNGKVIRRYTGQDKNQYVKAKTKEGHRKMIAILVEVPDAHQK